MKFILKKYFWMLRVMGKKVVIISGGGEENTNQLNENIQFESLPDPARFNQLLSQSKNIIWISIVND